MGRMTTLIFFLVFSTMAVVSVNAGEDQEVTFAIKKMTCAACPIVVSKAMKRVDGVKEVSVNYEADTATVTYDKSRTDVEHIGAASRNVGFPATVLKESHQ